MVRVKKFLSISELKNGMIAARDVQSGGKILLGSGTLITDQIISKLKDLYFYDKIEVYYNSPDSVDPYIKPTKSVEEVDKVFNELSFDVRTIFNEMDLLQASGINEVRKFAARIQEELESTSSVMKNIVLYGSGDDAVYRHGVNVAALSTILGGWLGLSENQLKLLTYSAVLHDFGKSKIDKHILDKAGTLTTKEYSIMKEHPSVGYKYITKIPFLDKSVHYGILMHHEKEDGSGYPLGLKADQIHQFAKIIAIADVFDAVNSNRIFRDSKKPFEALEIIKKESLGKLNYEYCNVFLNHVVNYYIGEKVLLSNGKTCKIVQIDVNDIARPLLFDGLDFIDLKKHSNLTVEKLLQ